MRRGPARPARLGRGEAHVRAPGSAREGNIGVRVLAELEALAIGSGLTLLRLETGIHNREALALYRRVRIFTERGPFGDYASDPLSVFMEKACKSVGFS